jgi:hypothetical protein
MPYTKYLPCYDCKLTVDTPPAVVFVAEGTIDETAEEVDVTPAAATAGDWYPGRCDVAMNLRVLHESEGLLVDVFRNGRQLSEVKLYPRQDAEAESGIWRLPFAGVTTVEHPIKVRDGVWQAQVRIRNRGPYDRPDRMPAAPEPPPPPPDDPPLEEP